MVTQSAGKVGCSQFHGRASWLCSALSPSLQCSYPCHSYARFKISCYFFLCYHHLSLPTLHVPVYLQHLHFTFWTSPWASRQLCSPFLTQNLVVAALSLHWAEQVECSLLEIASILLWRAEGLLLCSASLAEDLQFFGILNTTNHGPLPSQTLKTLEISFAFDEFLPVF